MASIIRITMLVQKSELNLSISKRVFHGWGIKEIAQRCLSPLEHPRNAIRRYSAAPIFQALRHDSHAVNLEEALLHGLRPKNGPHELLPVSSAVRRCPECMEEDLLRVGVACARVLHQLIGVAHCPTHNAPLQQACAGCGRKFEELQIRVNKIKSMVPDLMVCSKCGCSSGINLAQPRGRAYRHYVDLVAQALAGRAWILKPDIRKHLVDRTMKLACDEDVQIPIAFAEEWGADSFEEAAALCGASPKHLLRVFSGVDLGRYTVASLMAIAFALSFLSSRKIHYEGPFCELNDIVEGSGVKSETFDERLRKAGKKNAIPAVVLERLATGSGWDYYSKNFGAIASLRDSLSDEDRSQLAHREVEYQAAQSIRFSDFGRQRTLNRYATRDLVRRVLRGQDLLKAMPHVLTFRRDLCEWMRVHDHEWFNEIAPGLYELFFDEKHGLCATREMLLSRTDTYKALHSQ